MGSFTQELCNDKFPPKRKHLIGYVSEPLQSPLKLIHVNKRGPPPPMQALGSFQKKPADINLKETKYHPRKSKKPPTLESECLISHH